jgi:hypothetical protein
MKEIRKMCANQRGVPRCFESLTLTDGGYFMLFSFKHSCLSDYQHYLPLVTVITITELFQSNHRVMELNPTEKDALHKSKPYADFMQSRNIALSC